MPASNLAKVFGPTIVGYSSVEAEPMKMFAETTKQAKVGPLLRETHYIAHSFYQILVYSDAAYINLLLTLTLTVVLAMPVEWPIF